MRPNLSPNRQKIQRPEANRYEEIEKSLACIQKLDMNKAPQSGWF